MDRTFEAHYDATVKTIIAVVCVLMAAAAWMAHIIFILPVFLLLLFLAYAFSPRAYAISEDAVVIKRLVGDVRVPRADITGMRPGAADDFSGWRRIRGSSGLFGYYGLFRTAKLGKGYWYVTDRANTVIISTNAKVLVISPADVADFVQAAGVSSAGITSDNAAASLRSFRSVSGIALAAAVAGLVMAIAALAISYSPGPPSYTLTDNQLTIHDRLYPVTLHADQVDVPNIRVVDLKSDPAWRPTLRTNGFANGHYQSGWFRVAGGATVRLYRAGGTRLVLIPGKGGPTVLYQAMNPDDFARKLRQTWLRVAPPPV